jgi:hypothetical protein
MGGHYFDLITGYPIAKVRIRPEPALIVRFTKRLPHRHKQATATKKQQKQVRTSSTAAAEVKYRRGGQQPTSSNSPWSL